MSKKITIAIDAMGGENSPQKTVKGVHLFLKKNRSQNDFILNLFGDKKIKPELEKLKVSDNLVNIIHSDSVVSDRRLL